MPLETIFLGAAAWIFDQYGKDLTDKTLDAACQQWDGVRSHQAIEDSPLLPAGEED